jgi:hypothetical protein
MFVFIYFASIFIMNRFITDIIPIFITSPAKPKLTFTSYMITSSIHQLVHFYCSYLYKFHNHQIFLLFSIIFYYFLLFKKIYNCLRIHLDTLFGFCLHASSKFLPKLSTIFLLNLGCCIIILAIFFFVPLYLI